MADKFRKIDKEYVLSDSSVNEYGFRLLTGGYQLHEFQKNPIGYYMHRRENGVALKWGDIQITGDKITGKPVINLSNERGEQTCDEVEDGFLNAASMGHIVVLEYATDPEMMLPGQTGPTITKWYNKECSLVDIPGNGNSLTQLYDAQENEINLADFTAGSLKEKLSTVQANVMNDKLAAALKNLLGVQDADAEILLAGVKSHIEKTSVLEMENTLLRNDKQALQEKIDGMNATYDRYEIVALLDRALEDKKITNELKTKLAADYAANPTGLKSLLAAMPAYRSIVEHLKSAEREDLSLQWGWDDFEKNDPAGKKLKQLKAENPARFKEIFDGKFPGAVK